MFISVVLPVFNNAPYLKQSLDSLISQSHRELEVIVVDDGSTDGSGDIARGTGDPRVRVVRRENGGCAAARNTGLDHLDDRCQAVTFHDGDDVSFPHRFRALVRALDQSGADYAYSAMLFVDPDLAPLQYVPGGPLQQHHALPHLLRHGNMWNNISWLTRVEAIGDLRSDEELKIGDDTVFSSHVAIRSTGVYVPEALMLYRRHPRSLSLGETLADSLVWRRSLIRDHRLEDLVPAAFRAFDDRADATAVAWAEVGLAQARLGHLDDARERFQLALSRPVSADAAAHVRAAVHIAVGELPQAHDALAAVSPTAMSVNHQGELALVAGHRSAGVELLLESLRRDPDYFDPASTLRMF